MRWSYLLHAVVGFVIIPASMFVIVMGHWAIGGARFAVATTFGLILARDFDRSIRDQSRRRLGLCRICGYDLRATLGRCPECGADLNAQTS